AAERARAFIYPSLSSIAVKKCSSARLTIRRSAGLLSQNGKINGPLVIVVPVIRPVAHAQNRRDPRKRAENRRIHLNIDHSQVVVVTGGETEIHAAQNGPGIADIPAKIDISSACARSTTPIFSKRNRTCADIHC